ncbi:MAG TPA: ADP-ribosylglycohydrolase family protein [Ilumatobacter sp.]|nr:ADP-ribosylglycohydrolase family protein [Ilumatobacter sp.]
MSATNTTITPDAGVRDRAVGALVGLAAGDAVGTTLEFRAPGTFTPITDMVGRGPFGLAAGQWTDDTSMAMCLAESIVDTGGLHPADQLRRYVLWRREGYWSSTGQCFDIGTTTSRALDRFEHTGAIADEVVDQSRAANGSLMRLAPVPIRWHTDVAPAAERSAESSRTTHAAARPVDACRVMGAMIAALIQGADWDAVAAPDFWQHGPLDPTVAAVAAGSWRTKQPPEIRGSGYSVEALEAALWAVGGAGDFRDAVLRAANLGDDADTTAAIAGQLAGARWGVAGIPDVWRSRLTSIDRIEALADRLYQAGSGTSPDRWRHDEFVHAWWVEPGQLLAGEYPGNADAARAAEKIDLLIDHGVRTFVDLTTPDDQLAEYATHVAHAAGRRGLDVRHIGHPIPDLGVIDQPGYDQIAATIRGARGRGAVYVHCWGGIGRTGTVAGCVLIDSGLTADEAIAKLARLRTGTRKSHRPAPETPAQVDALHQRQRR